MGTWKKVVVESTTGNITQKAATSGTADNITSQGNLATLNTVDTGQIDANAITTVKITDDAVTGAKIADDTLTSAHYAEGSVDRFAIEANGIRAGNLDDNCVQTDKIDADAVTNAKIADDAVNIENLSATGTADSGTYLRGDNTWAQVSQVTVDSALSSSSSNPVENHVVYDALALKLNATGGFTANRAIVSTAGGSLGNLDVTSDEVGYLDGVTSSIQTQLNGKQASGAYAAAAGSSSQSFATANLVVSGNLTVSGTSTTVNTETIELADNTILLNSNESGTPSADAGLVVERGTSTNKALIWDESASSWSIGHSESGTAGATTFSVDGKIVVANKFATSTTPTSDSNAIGCIQVNANDDIWIRVD